MASWKTIRIGKHRGEGARRLREVTRGSEKLYLEEEVVGVVVAERSAGGFDGVVAVTPAVVEAEGALRLTL